MIKLLEEIKESQIEALYEEVTKVKDLYQMGDLPVRFLFGLYIIANCPIALECPCNEKFKSLYNLIKEYASNYVEKYIPDWNQCYLNKNVNTPPHVDGCDGMAYIVSFGDYEGGNLYIEGKKYDVKLKPILYEADKLKHWNDENTGNKYSLVYIKSNPMKEVLYYK